MDIDKNIVSHEVLSASNNLPFQLDSLNSSFKTNFTKTNLINHSNSNLSKKINDLSKTMGHSNININTLNIYADNNYNKDVNNSMSNKLYSSAFEEPSSTDIDFTENNQPCPTEDSLGLDSNSIRLSNINHSNVLSSVNVTSFTTTANPIPIPVNSSSFHTNENRNLTSYSYVNSEETPTTLSMENINERLNSSDNMNSLSLFYQSDIDFNNSLNSNNLSILNNSIMALQSQQQQQQQRQQQRQSIQPQPPTFITTTTANPLLSHEQAKNVSFSSYLSSNHNNKETSTLLNTNNNNNSFDNISSNSTIIKQEPDIESTIKLKLDESMTPLASSLNNNNTNKSTMNIDINLDMDYPSNLNDFSKLSSSIPPPPPPPPSQTSSDINGSLDLNTILSNKISNLHIHSLFDLNSQEASSSTSTNNNNILSTNDTVTDIQSSSSSSFTSTIKNQFNTSVSTSTSNITPATVTTTTATKIDTINPFINNMYYSNINNNNNNNNNNSNNNNNNNLKHKINNSIIYRKSYIKKPPQQQYEKTLSNSKYLNYPLSSSLKLVKKEPGTKINFVKKKVSLKSALTSSLDSKLSNMDEINKKYNNNILHTPHHHSGGINKDVNNMMSPSFVITSPDHVSKPLDNYELSNQIQQVPVSVVTSNNSYSGNNIFVRSNTLAIPTRNIRNYGYDSHSLGSTHAKKTIQNKHIVNNSLNDDLFNGGSNSFPYKYNPPTAFHKGYFSLASQLDILNEKRKKRKESHNATERRRRDFINEKIFELSTLIPDSFFEQCTNENRAHKGVILQKSVDYINHLLTSLKNQQEYTSKLEKEIINQSSSKNN